MNFEMEMLKTLAVVTVMLSIFITVKYEDFSNGIVAIIESAIIMILCVLFCYAIVLILLTFIFC